MAVEKNLMMFAICIILGTFASQATSRAVRASIAEKFEQWMAEYGRVYHDNTEKERRFIIFKKNVEFVEKFNNDGSKMYRLGINQFSDLTEEEVLKHHTGFKTPSESSFTTSSEDESFMYQSLSTEEIPATMDWREHGAVTPIKDQERCSACWAFAAVAAVEGITKIKTGKLVSLSEQQVLECNKDDFRCKQPGDILSAFKYIMNNGLATEEEYPYVNPSETTMHMCNTSKATNVHKQATNITSYQRVPRAYGTNDNLLKAVSRQPVSAGIDGSGIEFHRYNGGVFNRPCGSTLNHAVTIIGYGTENDTNYWLIKNSWGTTWGEKGYMRIVRTNYSGLCGLDLYAYYPII